MGVLGNIKGFFGKTLYYPGCTTHYKLPHLEERYKEILKKLGIKFVMLENLNCCGLPVLNAGYKVDFEELKEKNYRLLKKNGISRIIVNCPECYHFLKEEYGLNVVHISQLLAKNKEMIKFKEEGEAAYHAPCYFTRYSKVDKPIEVIEKTGIEINQVCRECCGAGGNFKQNFPKQADQVAKLRLSKVNAKKLITPCPNCYMHFKENAKEHEIIELSEVIEL